MNVCSGVRFFILPAVCVWRPSSYNAAFGRAGRVFVCAREAIENEIENKSINFAVKSITTTNNVLRTIYDNDVFEFGHCFDSTLLKKKYKSNCDVKCSKMKSHFTTEGAKVQQINSTFAPSARIHADFTDLHNLHDICAALKSEISHF